MTVITFPAPAARGVATSPSALAPSRMATERAAADLARGRPVLVQSPEGDSLVIAGAFGFEGAVETLAALGLTGGALVVTQHRMRALGPEVEAPQAFQLAAFDAGTVERLATAHDLVGLEGHSYRPAGAAERAAIRLVKRSRLVPAVLAVSESDGRLGLLAAGHDLLTVAAATLEAEAAERKVELIPAGSTPVPLADGIQSRLTLLREPAADVDHLIIEVGTIDRSRPVPVRLHSACLTGDLLGSLRCDCGPQLRRTVERLHEEGGGIVLYLAQEGRGMGLGNKLMAYSIQDEGLDTFQANETLGFAPDERNYAVAAAMLQAARVDRVRLITNNPDKIAQLRAAGVDVVDRMSMVIPANPHNERYLEAKALSGHMLEGSGV